jgi:predicted nucleic acid-binding protein
LIVAAAASANCEKVLTEDMNDGQTISGVKMGNPYVKTK